PPGTSCAAVSERPRAVSALLAGLGQRLARRERLRVELELDDGGLAAGQRRSKGGREVGRGLDGVALGPETAGVGREVGVDERRPDDATGVFALLVRADRAVQAVVGDDGDD